MSLEPAIQIPNSLLRVRRGYNQYHLLLLVVVGSKSGLRKLNSKSQQRRTRKSIILSGGRIPPFSVSFAFDVDLCGEWTVRNFRNKIFRKSEETFPRLENLINYVCQCKQRCVVVVGGPFLLPVCKLKFFPCPRCLWVSMEWVHGQCSQLLNLDQNSINTEFKNLSITIYPLAQCPCPVLQCHHLNSLGNNHKNGR